MFKKSQKEKDKIIKDKVKEAGSQLSDITLSDEIDKNIAMIKEVFRDVETISFKEFINANRKSLKFCLVSTKCMVNKEVLSEFVIMPLIKSDIKAGEGIAQDIMDRVLFSLEISSAEDVKAIVEGVTYGDSALFISGTNRVVMIGAKQFHTRAISEPDSERVIKGPREGFNESVNINLSLMHRKLRTNDFKIRLFKCGDTSNTQVAICYMDNVVNHKILQMLITKIKQAQLDNVLDSNYISEMIRGNKFSPFRTVGTTERPDSLAGKILEGRIGIIVDGSPVALTIPRLFIENFQNSEDYFVNYYYSSFSRILRILAFFLSVVTPALYIAVVAYHHEMIPTNLLINITIERQTVPLPAALEAVIMLIIFDILRETGIRTPQGMGQALSIVGALVIGQAAVEAKMIAAPMIIVVALTGITSLLIPKLSGAIIMCRLFLLALAAMLGFVGLIVGMSLILIHLLNLNSFGVPQLSPLSKLKLHDAKDLFVRAPMWLMKKDNIATSKKKVGITEKNHEN